MQRAVEGAEFASAYFSKRLGCADQLGNDEQPFLVIRATKVRLGMGQFAHARTDLNTAERQLTAQIKHATSQKEEAETRVFFALLAGEFRALGNEIKAARWLALAQQNETELRRARMALDFAVAPVALLEARPRAQTGFSFLQRGQCSPLLRGKRAQIAQEVRRLWPKLDASARFDTLQLVCASQLDAGETQNAKESLFFLEKFASSLSVTDYDGDPELQVASGWRRLGDEARTQKLLRPDLASLENEKDWGSVVTSGLEGYGFVEEAATLYARRTPKEFSDWPYRVAEAAVRFQSTPGFPKWITNIKDAPTRRLAIGVYVEQITKPLRFTGRTRFALASANDLLNLP